MRLARPSLVVLATLALASLVTDAQQQQAPPQQPERQITGVVSGQGGQRIKIALPDVGSGPQAQELIQVVRDDLDFSGLFEVVDPTLYRLVPAPGSGAPAHQKWLSIGADALMQGTLSPQGARIDLAARLYDNSGGSLLFHRRYGGANDQTRRVAHSLANDIIAQYSGRPGVALTRIAFVSKHGKGKEVYLMDYDGKRVRRLTTSATINLSPAWSPSGGELAFVSWRGKQPGVYIMNSEGKLGPLGTLRAELSSSPDWSPDGAELAYSSNAEGNTEIYVLERGRNRNRRLTHHPAIDTAPAFSPNGREIAFTSDRGGTPQVFLMDRDGLNVRRISREGSYNDSAAWSPDGGKLAYASRLDGRFEIVVLDLGSGKVTQLTRGAGDNENPRWSPDGRHLVFASNRAGTYDIYVMRADGSDVRRMTRGVDSYTPDWSR